MKVLIISMTIGEGHNQIAKAVANSLIKHGAETKIVQLFGYNEKDAARQNKIYLSACKFIPHLYDKIWLHACKKPYKSYINGVIKSCESYILGEINNYCPDAIVCTHNNAGAVVSHLLEAGKLDRKIKTYGIVFDYCICPNWEYNTGLDYAVLPHENLIDEMIEKGFAREQLIPLGLPVDVKFTVALDKKAIREKLGLDAEKFTVVLYSGGNCVSSAYTIIKELLKCKTDIQIVAVCGKNEKEHEKIENLIRKKNLKNILNLGFCTYLDELYSAGDIVITRGGGMGNTEQINKHIPMVLREKLFINEKINKIYFQKIGLSESMKKLSDAPKIIDKLANDKAKLAEMTQTARAFCKPTATVDLVKHILGTEDDRI